MRQPLTPARRSLLLVVALLILWIVLKDYLEDADDGLPPVVTRRHQRWQDGERSQSLLSSDDVAARLGFADDEEGTEDE